VKVFSSCIALLATTVLFVACASHDDVGPPVPIDDLAHLLADTYCNNIGSCCEAAGFPHDAAKCMVQIEADLNREFARRRASHVDYDGVAARACVDVTAEAIETCRERADRDTICRRVFTGTLPVGQSCKEPDECVPGASCDFATTSGGSGLCVDGTFGHGKLKEPCSFTCTIESDGISGSCVPTSGTGSALCFTNDGLYCDPTQGCLTVPTLGQACPASAPCAGEAFCDVDVCVAKRTSGPCSELTKSCAGTAYCDSATRQYALRKSRGAACTLDDECAPTDSCNIGVCGPPTIATPTNCVKP
jgi:hypothetical protein